MTNPNWSLTSPFQRSSQRTAATGATASSSAVFGAATPASPSVGQNIEASWPQRCAEKLLLVVNRADDMAERIQRAVGHLGVDLVEVTDSEVNGVIEEARSAGQLYSHEIDPSAETQNPT